MFGFTLSRNASRRSLTDGDKLNYVLGSIRGKLLESDELTSQAKNNSHAQFASSPTLMPELINALIDAKGAYDALSSQALASDKVRAGILDILLGPGQLYEELRKDSEQE